MTDLLPCPFCGGTPKLRTHRTGEDSEEAFVECPNCEVRTTYYEDVYAPTADAIAAWNRRAPSPTPHVRVGLFDGATPMADGGEVAMTAAEEVLAWLLIEKIGVPDDVSYTPDQAQEIIAQNLDQAANQLVDGGELLLQAEGVIADLTKLLQAAKEVIACASDTYKKRNGHLASFEDDSGEKCWIVPFDAFEGLRSAVDALSTTEGKDNDLPYICDACTSGAVSGCQCQPSPPPQDAEALQPRAHLRVTKLDTIDQFVAALADHGVKLPLLGTDEDVGTLVDADGKPVLVVDVDRDRSDEDVAWIVGMIQVAVNTCGGFKAQRTATTEALPDAG